MIGGRIRVLLIEDQRIVLEGLKLILRDAPDIEVIAEASDGTTGLRLHERLASAGGVDVVVTDLSLPDIDGQEIARRIKAQHPATRILVLTMLSGDGHVRGVIESGAEGYLLKESSPEELLEAIRAVARGEVALSPTIARWLVAQQRQRNTDRGRVGTILSERERQILTLLAEGSTSKEIAHELALSTKTVSNHRARIITKLGVTNTAAAIGLAYQQGLIDATEPD